jgi:hypothetical protein
VEGGEMLEEGDAARKIRRRGGAENIGYRMRAAL